jgi:hypothetical protein
MRLKANILHGRVNLRYSQLNQKATFSISN